MGDVLTAIEGDYRFAFTKTTTVFHLYDDRCLCRAPNSEEIGIRKARKWYLKDGLTRVPDNFSLCLDCLHVLREGERAPQVREDIREVVGTAHDRPPENPFTKSELRKIRAQLTNKGES